MARDYPPSSYPRGTKIGGPGEERNLWDDIEERIGEGQGRYNVADHLASSNILHAYYDRLEQRAYVTMNGGEYMYDIPEDEFERFVNSPSPGAYINMRR